jgi:hypothetical protein
MAHLMQYVHASAESKNFLNKKRKKCKSTFSVRTLSGLFITTPSVLKYLSQLTFFTTLNICLVQKIMQVSFTLLVTCFIIVGILSLSYPFTHLREFFK